MSMLSTFCQAGGTKIDMAWNKLIPPEINTSSILSKLEESEPVRLTKGCSWVISGSFGVSSLGVRATDQLRLAVIVFSSPLCAK